VLILVSLVVIRFSVRVLDREAVQIRKNGHPIAYQSPGISIQ